MLNYQRVPPMETPDMTSAAEGRWTRRNRSCHPRPSPSLMLGCSTWSRSEVLKFWSLDMCQNISWHGDILWYFVIFGDIWWYLMIILILKLKHIKLFLRTHFLSVSLSLFDVYVCLGYAQKVSWFCDADFYKPSKLYWYTKGEHKEHSRVESSRRQNSLLTPQSSNIHEQNKVMFIQVLFRTHVDLPIRTVDIVLDFAQRPSKRRLMAFCDHWPNTTTNGTTNGHPMIQNHSSTSHLTKAYKPYAIKWLIKSCGKPRKDPL